MQITHIENNYARITQELRNVLGNAPFYQNYAKITQITQKLRKLRKCQKITQITHLMFSSLAL